LILKDQSGVEVLPVWLNALDAAVALSELSQGHTSSPHAATRHLLQALNLKIESCSFTELIGHHQYVHLGFAPVDSVRADLEKQSFACPTPLRLRADEVMSLCLQAKARFFSTRSHMARCRDLDVELGSLEEGLASGQLSALRRDLEISSKKHPYMM
jgi:hypothetical protein